MTTPAHQNKQDVSALKSHIGYWMRLVSNHVSHTFARRLESMDVTVAEWVVLREMFESNTPTSPSAIADVTGLTRGAASKLVERLLKKGLVTRKEAASDRRYQEIRLTKAATLLVPTLGKLADENDESFFGALTDSERKALRHVLVRLATCHSLHQSPIE